MRGDVDLVVRSEGTPRVALVAQTKYHLDPAHKDVAEAQLKKYMLASRCPVGLIVTPEVTYIMIDSFEGYSESSIREAGEFNTTDLLGLEKPPENERALNTAVQRWLEQLTSGWPSSLPHAPEARATVLRELVPAVAEGRVTTESFE